MTAEEYFEEHCTLWPRGDRQAEQYIDKEDFLRFNEMKEQYATNRIVELKDQIIPLLENLVINEWNLSGGGVTRIKDFLSVLNASK